MHRFPAFLPFTQAVNGPITVVGDLHGQHQLLHDLLKNLQTRSDFAKRWLIFLGDFVDRGPGSREVIDTLLTLRERHPKTTAVMGNHDLALAGALNLVPN